MGRGPTEAEFAEYAARRGSAACALELAPHPMLNAGYKASAPRAS